MRPVEENGGPLTASSGRIPAGSTSPSPARPPPVCDLSQPSRPERATAFSASSTAAFAPPPRACWPCRLQNTTTRAAASTPPWRPRRRRWRGGTQLCHHRLAAARVLVVSPAKHDHPRRGLDPAVAPTAKRMARRYAAQSPHPIPVSASTASAVACDDPPPPWWSPPLSRSDGVKAEVGRRKSCCHH